MNFKAVLHYLGLVLTIISVLMLLPVVVSYIFNEDVYVPFIFGFVVTMSFGIALRKKFPRGNLTLGSAMVLASLTFVLMSAFGSLVYLDHLDLLDAFFESVSGFTTTGLTVIEPETFPYSLLFWRAMTQWIGGIGILVIFLLMLSSPGMSSYYIYRAEGHPERIEASVYHTVKRIFLIYITYTIAGIFLLCFFGMPVFDAVVHAFTSVSTGGFSIKNGSVGSYNAPAIYAVMVVLMTLGGTSFFIHNSIFKRNFKEYFKNGETQLFWAIILTFSVLLSVAFVSASRPFADGIFYTFSALTTTGFSIAGIHSEFSKFLIIILMIVGGFAGSTAGGLKLVRVGILGKAVVWVSKKISYPLSAVVPFKFYGKLIRDDELTIISLFSFIYLAILVISTTIISLLGYSPIDSFFVSASAEGTVGLSTIDISSMNPAGKIVLIIDMLLGRLEILPFFVLFNSIWVAMRKR